MFLLLDSMADTWLSDAGGTALAQPDRVLDDERVDRHRQRLRVHLGKLFAARVVLVEAFKHVLWDLLRPGAVDFEHLVRVRVVGVQAAELELGIAEQDQKVGTVEAVDFFEDRFAGLLVDGAGEDNILDCIHEDGPVGLDGGGAVEVALVLLLRVVGWPTGGGRDFWVAVIIVVPAWNIQKSIYIFYTWSFILKTSSWLYVVDSKDIVLTFSF